MGLLSALVGLPLAPVRGVIWVAEQVAEQAQQEMTDPDRIRRQLEDIDRARAEGALSAEEAEAMEDELMRRLLDAPRAAQWEV
jgi:cytochrome c-type biogenesis protein CcmI